MIIFDHMISYEKEEESASHSCLRCCSGKLMMAREDEIHNSSPLPHPMESTGKKLILQIEVENVPPLLPERL